MEQNYEASPRRTRKQKLSSGHTLLSPSYLLKAEYQTPHKLNAQDGNFPAGSSLVTVVNGVVAHKSLRFNQIFASTQLLIAICYILLVYLSALLGTDGQLFEFCEIIYYCIQNILPQSTKEEHLIA